MSNPNTNCLDGWKCPACGSYGDFKIDASIDVRVIMSDEGTVEEQVSSTVWDGYSWAACCECGHEATVKDFQEEEASHNE